MKRARLSASLLSTAVSKHGAVRPFTSVSRRREATNFTMPALSPTMTEGSIAKWRVKEGDNFSAGDVLLEIETDKATMDVEAQDDGIMMKIIAPDESKAIQVGARIAVMAEPGDDIAKLELPPDESSQKQTTKAQEERVNEQQKSESASEKQESAKESSPENQGDQSKQTPSTQNDADHSQKHPLYPSVQHLLHQNGLPDSAANEILASGPNGRLLKGDVLAYLGRIDKSYPAEASTRLQKLSHLDLSNIQLAEANPKSAAAPTAASEEQAVEPPQEIDLALPISLSAVLETQKRVEELLNTTIPLSVFVARASELANEDLPLPKKRQVSSDELFNAVLGLPTSTKSTSRGHFIPQLSTIDLAAPTRQQSVLQPDIIDVLSGAESSRAGSVRTRSHPPSTVERDLFSVTARPGEEQRAMIYLERLKMALEKDPGRLVL